MVDLRVKRRTQMGRRLSGWVAGVLVVAVCQTTAFAQVDEVARLIHVAKSIKELVVKQCDSVDASKSGTQQGFEVTAYDKDGKVINVSPEQANKLYKWSAKNSSGAEVGQKGLIERVESVNSKARKARNVLKMTLDKGQKAAELEVRLADKFSTYSSAVGKSPIAVGKSGTGLLKSSGKLIAKHPYISTAGAVVAVGGVAAAGGGGSSSSSATGDGGGTSSTGDAATGASGAIDVTGSWSGTASGGEAGTDPISMNLVQSGSSISGSQNGGGLTGTINGSSVSFRFTFSDGYDAVLSGTVSGNAMSGTWYDDQYTGAWSVTRN